MAIVRITSDLVSSICAKTRSLFDKRRLKLDTTVPSVVPGIGEYFLGLAFPIKDQKKIYDMYPVGLKPMQRTVVGLQFKHHNTKLGWNHAPVVHVPVQDCLEVYTSVFVDLPGVKILTMNGPLVQVELDEDLSSMPALIKDFAVKCADIHAKYAAITKKSKTAVENMRNFLKDHRTLQSAIKAMPALKFYLDPWIIQEMERKVEMKPRKPKTEQEKPVYDISELITEAALDRLSI